MTKPPVVRHISPMLAAADMDQTLAFYREALGFEVSMHTPTYSILERDGQTLHISAPASEDTLACMRTNTSIYLEVSNLFALWEHVETLADRYPARAPSDRDYGMTEFHIKDPNGCLIFVGQATAAAYSTRES